MRHHHAEIQGGPESICRVFEEQAQYDPAAPAIDDLNATLGYGELNARANRLARHLRACGVRPDGLVAICMQRTPSLFEGVLSVLKAGGAYLPLDPSYPLERLAEMLADARPTAVLTDAASRAVLAQALRIARIDTQTIDLDLDAAQWSSQPSENLAAEENGVGPQHLAYVIYTSGSTGKPKGVMVEHASVMNLLRAQSETFALDRQSRVLQFASFSFDACVFEWVMAFGHGACLCLGAPGEALVGEALAAAIQAHRATHATLPPVALSTLHEATALPSLRVLISAGEALPLAQMRRWSRGRTMFNAYGPTETTVWCTVHPCDPEANATSVPIGRAILNAQAYLLDENRQPVIGREIGELYVGGSGVARGYLNRPELTAERFIDDPLRPGERMYRTGDLGRWLPDGGIEYLGRNDFQVKIRGYRIELGEIEAALNAQPGVQDTSVLAREDGDGQRQLVAYVLAEAAPQPQTLRAALSAVLPDYMVPSAYVRMAVWPQTPNGKLDRNALPAPKAEDYAREAFVAPDTTTERLLASMWCEVLGAERVGREDRFLDLGGNSLKIIQLAPRIQAQFDRKIEVHALFKAPTLRSMAELIDTRVADFKRDNDEAIGVFDDWSSDAPPTPCPVSYQQQGLWLLEQVSKTSLAYNAQNVIRIRGEVSIDALQRALDRVIERHEIFRTTFHADANGEPNQVVHPRAPGVLRFVELDADIDDDAMHEMIDAHVAHRFDLAQLPLLHLTLIRRAQGEYVLIHVEQHYVHDGWSANLFMRELLTAYAADVRDESPPLAPVPAQYRDYARWQRSDCARTRFARHLAFWTAQLADVPKLLPMPTDFPRPAQPSYNGMQLRCELPLDLAQELRRFCRDQGVTLYAALQAVYQIVLRQYCGADVFLIGSAVANRKSRKSEGMLGMFVNMIPIRADLTGDHTGDLSYRALLDRVMTTLSVSYEHEELPFELLVRELQPDRKTGHNPLFQTAFSAHNSDLPSLRWPGFEMSMFEAYSNRTSKFDFDVVMLPRGQEHFESITLLWNFATDLYRVETIERMRDAYLSVLTQCMANPDRRLSAIEALSPPERERLLEGGYRAADFDRDRCLHQAFEAHAARAPDRPAITARQTQWSYGELNRRANRLARHLRAQGVGLEAMVALCMQRTPVLFEAILGVMKAGGAYVPLDPTYPVERLAEMLADARPAVILTDAASRDALTHALMRADHRASLIDLDRDVGKWSSLPPSDLSVEDTGIRPHHLAYVIYTSGSTGKPKGVMVEHRGVMNLMAVQGRVFDVTPESRVLQFAALSFDACVFEWVMAFGHGARLCLAPPGDVLIGDALQKAIDEMGVTHTLLPPVVLSTLSDTALLPSLQVLISGGEALPPSQMQRWARGRRMFNAYGPTEDSVVSTLYACDADTALMSNVPIGKPLPNHRVCLLNALRQPVPIGAVGELYVGGVGVARGYLHRPTLTTERFIDDPFHPGERLYRTGDLGRWRPDGSIDYQGRNDFQVKIRGYRIELGEIEMALSAQRGVKEAVVLAREDAPGEKRLVAYYQTRPEAEVSAETLRGALQASLPEYMVPSAYVRMTTWPQTPNAKLDRHALPAPQTDEYRGESYVAPTTPIECALAELWANALSVERIGTHDDFFRSGGYSVLGLRLILTVNDAFGTQLSLRDLFEHRTVADMVEAIYASLAEDVPAIV